MSEGMSDHANGEDRVLERTGEDGRTPLEFCETVDMVNVFNEQEIQNIIRDFEAYVDSDTYNSAAVTLELIRYWRERGGSLMDAYRNFHWSPEAVQRKYTGGNCFMLSKKFIEDLQRRDNPVKGYIVSDRKVTDTLKRSDESKSRWEEAFDYVERSHGSVVIKYRHAEDPVDTVRFLHLEMGMGKKHKQYDNEEVFRTALEEREYVQTHLGITNPEEPTKRMLRTRRILVGFLGDPGKKTSFVIDIVKGLLAVKGGEGERFVRQETGIEGEKVALDIGMLLSPQRAKEEVTIV